MFRDLWPCSTRYSDSNHRSMSEDKTCTTLYFKHYASGRNLEICQRAKALVPALFYAQLSVSLSSNHPDGHRRTVVEHTLNILFLPGLHQDAHSSAHHSSSTVSLPSSSSPHHSAPSLPLPMTSFSIPSPFHFRLHIMTRLSFNEQGRITHHRDFWDIKDVLGLVPGLGLAQWITSRLTARGLSMISRFILGESVPTDKPFTRTRSHSYFHSYPESVDQTQPQSYAGSDWGDGDLEGGKLSTGVPRYGRNGLGLEGLE